MDFSLTEEQQLLRRTVREFAEKEIAPIAEELDETEEFPYALVPKLAELGIFGLLFPEKYGGGGSDTLSYTIALLVRSEDALGPLVQAVALPLLLLSGVLLPMALAPDWLRTIATFNPLYHAVEAMRALFNAQVGDDVVKVGIAWMVGLAVVSLAISSRVFNRATA